MMSSGPSAVSWHPTYTHVDLGSMHWTGMCGMVDLEHCRAELQAGPTPVRLHTHPSCPYGPAYHPTGLWEPCVSPLPISRAYLPLPQLGSKCVGPSSGAHLLGSQASATIA